MCICFDRLKYLQKMQGAARGSGHGKKNNVPCLLLSLSIAQWYCFPLTPCIGLRLMYECVSTVGLVLIA